MRRDLREAYPSPLSALFDSTTIVVTLSVYWFTSRAVQFSANVVPTASNYFAYVFLGEVSLLIPSLLFERQAQTLNRMAAEGTLDVVRGYPLSLPSLTVLMASAALPKEGLRLMAMLGVAGAAFGTWFSPSQLGTILLLQAIAAPVFIGMGLCGAAAYIRFGRGTAALSYLALLGNIFAGVYFPLSVLPQPLVRIAGELSPFTLHLEIVRKAVAEGWSADLYYPAVKLFLLGIAVLWVGNRLLRAAFAHLRRVGALPIASGRAY